MVAATLMTAVVAAVVMISVDGIGTSTSVNGISISWTSGGNGICCVTCGLALVDFVSFSSDGVLPFTPGGGSRTLGGTTRGL